MHANIDVDASGTFRNGILEAIDKVQKNKNDMALLQAYKALEPTFKASAKDACVSIHYKGHCISFKMEVHPYLIGGDFKNVYYRSNETYTHQTMLDISSFSGIGNYIGISGGLTQNITLLSALRLKNRIKSTTLCDRNGFQLLYNALQLARYDAMPKSINPLWHIKTVDSIEARNAFALYMEEKLKMDFVLKHDTLDNIIGMARRDSHFIYSSNAFGVEVEFENGAIARNRNAWETQHSGAKLVGTLEKSDNVKSGSVYMAASVNSPAAVLLRKDKPDGELAMPLYSYCSGDGSHSDCVHGK